MINGFLKFTIKFSYCDFKTQCTVSPCCWRYHIFWLQDIKKINIKALRKFLSCFQDFMVLSRLLGEK